MMSMNEYICIYTYIHIYKYIHAYTSILMHTIHAHCTTTFPQLTLSVVLAASGYACSSAATTSSPACFCAAQCSGRALSCTRGYQYLCMYTFVCTSALQRTISALLAAPGYVCSSAATTSGPAWFPAAQCSGRRPYCTGGGKKRCQHAIQVGWQERYCSHGDMRICVG